MNKRTFIVFGLVVAVLAVVIPWLAFRADGDADKRIAGRAAEMKQAKELFQTNCGNCHTLYAAGADGNFGPDLDELLGPGGAPSGEGAEKTVEQVKGRVLNAIENGVDSTSTEGRMPPGILSGEQAEEVAEFVALTAGEG